MCQKMQFKYKSSENFLVPPPKTTEKGNPWFFHLMH